MENRYKDVTAISSMMDLKEAPFPANIIELEVKGINKIWRDNKVRAVCMKHQSDSVHQEIIKTNEISEKLKEAVSQIIL